METMTAQATTHPRGLSLGGLLNFATEWLFFLLCLRMALNFTLHAHSPIAVLLVPAMAAAFWRPGLVVYLLALALPLYMGLHFIGIGTGIWFLKAGFAAIYIGWKLRDAIGGQPRLPRRESCLLDTLAILAFTSLAVTLLQHPLRYAAWWVLLGPPAGQNIYMNTIPGSFIFLSGIFFYKMLLRSSQGKLGQALESDRIFLFHALCIVFFVGVQLLFNLPQTDESRLNVFSPLSDKHSFASYVLILVFVFLGKVLRRESRFSLNMGLLLALLLALALSFSRTAWIAAVLFGAVLILSMLSWRKAVLSLALLALLGGVFVGAVAMFEDHDGALRQRLQAFSSPGRFLATPNLLWRFGFWQRAANMIEEYPLTGVGVGLFYSLGPEYVDPEQKEWLLTHGLEKPTWEMENAHNYFLQLAAELGLPAMLLFIAALLMILLPWQRRDRDLLLGIGAYLFTWLMSHPLLLFEQQLLFWTALGIYAARHPRLVSQDAHNRLCLPTALAVLVIVGAGYALYYTPHYKGDDAFEVGHYFDIVREDMYPRQFSTGRLVQPLARPGKHMTLVLDATPPPQGMEVVVRADEEILELLRFESPERLRRYYYLPETPSSDITIEAKAQGENGQDIPLDISPGMVVTSDLPFEKNHGNRHTFYELYKLRIPLSENRVIASFATGIHATYGLKDIDKSKDLFLFLYPPHDDLAARPLSITIRNEKRTLRQLDLRRNRWEIVHFPPREIQDSETLLFEVDRLHGSCKPGVMPWDCNAGLIVAIPLQDLEW